MEIKSPTAEEQARCAGSHGYPCQPVQWLEVPVDYSKTAKDLDNAVELLGQVMNNCSTCCTKVNTQCWNLINRATKKREALESSVESE